MPLTVPFIKGYVGFSFLYVVMVIGALNPKWKVTIRLKAVRAVYSIVGFVLLIVHPLNYAAQVLAQTRSIPWYGLISFTIMIPLFITSYITIRKKMKPNTWKQLQKFAYISYGLIFIHLLMQASTTQNKVIAIVLFMVYGILKAIKHTIGYKTKAKIA
jgi:sulfoxide reductase heme-binding subunit YedZ